MSDSRPPDAPPAPADPSARPLDDREQALIAAARETAFTLYEGTRVPHRSCGIALAETFGLPTPAYQALRRGGITGCGTCGAIRAGEQILGEILGDPDPTGAVTDALRSAVAWYQRQIPTRIDRGPAPDYVCNNLTAPLGPFTGPTRASFCTKLAADIAALTAEAVLRFAPAGVQLRVAPIAELADQPDAQPPGAPT
ncbi:hypothetical protein [Haliangium sp.]|uniref:hypothetical protein n=1 Tax=Haliangium sp. TaxID=2663208 RepID=UPI003D1077B5